MKLPMVILKGTSFVQTEGTENPIFTYDSVPALRLIYRGLLAHFGSVNFELILHAIEQLLPIASMRAGATLSDQSHPAIAAFMEVSRRYESLNDWSLLHVARQMVISEIHEEIQRKSAGLPSELPIHILINELANNFQLAVFTLNYDDVIDNTRVGWFDGFCGPTHTSTGGSRGGTYSQAAPFDPKAFDQWRNADQPLLVHLHGSVRFGPSRSNFGLVKYGTAREAGEAIQAVSGSVKTSGGQVVASDPIISGLNKAARLTLNPSPYGFYYRALVDSLLSTDRLLVIGYGARDEHVNTWLAQFVETHREKRRVGWLGMLTGKMVGERTAEKDMISLLSEQRFQDFQHNSAREQPDKLLELGYLLLGASGFPISDRAKHELIAFLGG
jgi:hypothetical protein